MAVTSKTSFAEKNVRVAILGGGGVGKSAVTVQYVKRTFAEEYNPTIEDSYRTHTILNEQGLPPKTYCLEIIDCAGQEEFRSIIDAYIRDCEAFMLVYDITQPSSIEELEYFVSKIRDIKEKPNFPCVVVGNKIDLENRKLTLENSKEYLEKDLKLSCPLIETSAKKRINIDEAFTGLLRETVFYRRGGKPASASPPAKPQKKKTSLASLLFKSVKEDDD